MCMLILRMYFSTMLFDESLAFRVRRVLTDPKDSYLQTLCGSQHGTQGFLPEDLLELIGTIVTSYHSREVELAETQRTLDELAKATEGFEAEDLVSGDEEEEGYESNEEEEEKEGPRTPPVVIMHDVDEDAGIRVYSSAEALELESIEGADELDRDSEAKVQPPVAEPEPEPEPEDDNDPVYSSPPEEKEKPQEVPPSVEEEEPAAADLPPPEPISPLIQPVSNAAGWTGDDTYTEGDHESGYVSLSESSDDAGGPGAQRDVNSQAGDDEPEGSEEAQTGLGGQSATAVQDIMMRARLSSPE